MESLNPPDHINPDDEIETANEEETIREIEELLNQVEQNDFAAKMKKEIKSRMHSAYHTFSKIVEREKLKVANVEDLMELDQINTKKESKSPKKTDSSHPKTADSERTSSPSRAGSIDGNSLVAVMLQKKVANLKKQLEVAEQKSRSVTSQWTSDKSKFSETLEGFKKENDELKSKCQTLERKLRVMEQFRRDPNMLKTEQEAEDEKELERLKASLETIERDYAEKKQILAQVSVELSDTRLELTTSLNKIDVLSKKIEDASKLEDDLKRKIEDLNSNISSKNDSITELEYKLEDTMKRNDYLYSQINDLESKMKDKELEFQNQLQFEKQTINDLKSLIETLVKEKEELVKQHEAQFDQMNREKSKLMLEKEQEIRNSKHILRALQHTALALQDFLKDMTESSKLTDQKISKQEGVTIHLTKQLNNLTENISNVLVEAKTRVEESEKKLQNTQAAIQEAVQNQTKLNNELSKELNEAKDHSQLLLQTIEQLNKEKRDLNIKIQEVEKKASEQESLKEIKTNLEGHLDTIQTTMNSKQLYLEDKIKILSDKVENVQIKHYQTLTVQLELQKNFNQLKNAFETQAKESAAKVAEKDQNYQSLIDHMKFELDHMRFELEDVRGLYLREKERPKEVIQVMPTEKKKKSILKVEIVETIAPIVNEPSELLEEKVAIIEPEPIPEPEKPVLKKQFTNRSKPSVKRTNTNSSSISSFSGQLPVESTFIPIEKFDVDIQTDEPDPEENDKFLGDLDIHLQRIEEIVRSALVTNNYYFSQDSGRFSNVYPIEETFLVDLIHTFHQVSKDIIDILQESQKDLLEPSFLTNQIEKCVFKMAQELIIKLEKSKEEKINKLKSDFKEELTEKVDETVKLMNQAKQTALHDLTTKFENEKEQQEKKNFEENQKLKDRIKTMQDSFKKELELAKKAWEEELENESTDEEDLEVDKDQLSALEPVAAQHDLKDIQTENIIIQDNQIQILSNEKINSNSKNEDMGSLPPSTPNVSSSEITGDRSQLQTPLPPTHNQLQPPVPQVTTGKRKFSVKRKPSAQQAHAFDIWLKNLEVNMIPTNIKDQIIKEFEEDLRKTIYQDILNKQKVHEASLIRSNTMLEDEIHIFRNAFQDSIPQSESDLLITTENPFSEKDTEMQFKENKGLNDGVPSSRASSPKPEINLPPIKPLISRKAITRKSIEVEKSFEELWSKLPDQLKNIDLNKMREEILTGDLSHMGDIRMENFDRLKNKTFGTDDIIALTIMEHNLRYQQSPDEDNDDNPNPTPSTNNNAQVRMMQLKTLEIKRNMLMQKIVVNTSILDMMKFLYHTDKHLTLLTSLNAWKSILYYKSGGIFKDVLTVHRDVLESCIRVSGGMISAVRALAALNPDTVTSQWPDRFRIKALEAFRGELIRDQQLSNERIIEMQKKIDELSLAQSQSNLTVTSDVREVPSKDQGGLINPSLSVNIPKIIDNSNRKPISIENINTQIDRKMSTMSDDSSITDSISSIPLPNSRTPKNKKGNSQFIPRKPLNSKSLESKSTDEKDIEVNKNISETIENSNGKKGKGVDKDALNQLANGLMGLFADTDEPQNEAKGNVKEEKDRNYSSASLHSKVDQIIFRALKGDLEEREYLQRLDQAFSQWEQNHNISANNLFHSLLGINISSSFGNKNDDTMESKSEEINHDDIVGIFIKTSLNSSMPDDLKEIYMKIQETIDIYINYMNNSEEEEDSFSVIPENIQSSFDQNNVSKFIPNKVVPLLQKSSSQHFGKITTPKAYTSSRSNKPQTITTFECGTQTSLSLLDDSLNMLFLNASKRSSVMSVSESTTVVTNINSSQTNPMPSGIPKGFSFSSFKENEFEIIPGLFLTSLQQLKYFINDEAYLKMNGNKSKEELIHLLEFIPINIRYVHGPHINEVVLPISVKKPNPFLLNYLPKFSNCMPLIFPAVFPLKQGINLVTGFTYKGLSTFNYFSGLSKFQGKNYSGDMVTYPRDILLLQMAPTAELPRGLNLINVSNKLHLDFGLISENEKEIESMAAEEKKLMEDALTNKDPLDFYFFKKFKKVFIPPGHELVQLSENCMIDFPVGVEVSRGVRVATLPSNIKLPFNVKLVKKLKSTPLPDFMTALDIEEDVEEDLDLRNIDTSQSIVVVEKPRGIQYELGMEVISRPKGHPLPPEILIVPQCDYPEGLILPPEHELVQLAPKFDFPPDCRLTSAWIIHPRVWGLYLRPRQYIVYPDPQLEEHRIPLLPSFACPIPMPQLPYGVILPARAQAIEILNTKSTPFALPEGAILCPGITVLHPKSFKGWQKITSYRRPAVNLLLVKRLPGISLPETVERGSRSDLPPGVLLEENMDIIRVSVRFELPPGVQIDIGVRLGPCVQLAPGTQLLSSIISSALSNSQKSGSSSYQTFGNTGRSLTVLEWPHGMTLPVGVELVRKPPEDFFLPFEYQPVHKPGIILPPGTVLITLPRTVKILSTTELAKLVTVGIESMVSDHYHRSLSPGMILASRSSNALFPPEMRPVSVHSLPEKLVTLINQINNDTLEVAGDASKRKRQDHLEGASELKVKMNIEIVQLVPHFSLPGGVELVPGVHTVDIPFWFSLPSNVVIVRLANKDSEVMLYQKGIYIVSPRPDTIFSQYQTEASKQIYGANCFDYYSLPAMHVFVQLPDVYEVYSWRDVLPGVDAVSVSKDIALPPGHFLIERPRMKAEEELPSLGFALGIHESYKNIHINSSNLSSSVEIMHLIPSYRLPRGINIINTSVISRNVFNNHISNTTIGIGGATYTNKRFEPLWVPQLSPFEHISAQAIILPWPRRAGLLPYRPIDPIVSNMNSSSEDMNQYEEVQQTLFFDAHAIVFIQEPGPNGLPEGEYYLEDMIGKISESSSLLSCFVSTAKSLTFSPMITDLSKNPIDFIRIVRISNGFPNTNDRYFAHRTKEQLESTNKKKKNRSLGNFQVLSNSNSMSLFYPKIVRLKSFQPFIPDLEVGKHLSQMSIFRCEIRDKKQQEYILKLLKFNLGDATLWKSLTTIDELTKLNQELANKMNEISDENEQYKAQNEEINEENKDLKEKIFLSEDTDAVLRKYKTMHSQKTDECRKLTELLQETRERYDKQLDLLQGQIAEYSSMQYTNPPISQNNLNHPLVANNENKQPKKALESKDASFQSTQKILQAFFLYFIKPLILTLEKEITKKRGEFTLFEVNKENSYLNDLSLNNLQNIMSSSTVEKDLNQPPTTTMVNITKPKDYADDLISVNSAGDQSKVGNELLPPTTLPISPQGQNFISDDTDGISIITEGDAISTRFNLAKLKDKKRRNQLTSQSQPMIKGSSSSPTLAYKAHDLTKDQLGRHIEVSEDFPLDLKPLYAQSSQIQGDDYLTFIKPINDRSLLNGPSLSVLNSLPEQTFPNGHIQRTISDFLSRKRNAKREKRSNLISLDNQSVYSNGHKQGHENSKNSNVQDPNLLNRDEIMESFMNSVGVLQSNINKYSPLIGSLKVTNANNISEYQIDELPTSFEISSLDSESLSKLFTGFFKTVSILLNNCFDIRTFDYSKSLRLLELENQILFRDRKNLNNHNQLMKSLINESNQRGSTVVNEGLREKIWILESRVEKLLEEQVSPDISVLQPKIEEMINLAEAEKAFKFAALMSKQQANELDHQIQQKIKQSHQMTTIKDPSFDTQLFEKEISAEKFRVFQLKKRYQQFSERSEIIKNEIQEDITSLLHHIETYQRSIQNLLPPKLLKILLAKSNEYYDEQKFGKIKLNFPNVDQILGPDRSIDLLNDNVSVLSNFSAGNGSVGTQSLIANASLPSKTLPLGSQNLLAPLPKLGAIGGMSVASHSHLLARQNLPASSNASVMSTATSLASSTLPTRRNDVYSKKR